MKTKFYLPMVALAMAAVIFAGCSKDDPTPDPGPGPGPDPDPVEGSFTVKVSDITTTDAVIDVVPDNDETAYFFDCLELETYKEFGGTPDAFADYVPQLMEAIAEYYDMDIESVVAQLQSVGPDQGKMTGLEPSTDYVAYATAINPDGTTSGTAVVVPFKTKTGGPAPALTLTAQAGDPDGNDPSHLMACGMQSDIAASALYGLWDGSVLEAVEAGEVTFKELADAGNELPAQYIDGLNSKGVVATFQKLDPGTEYCFVVKVTAADGVYTVGHKEASTAAAGKTSMSLNYGQPRFDGMTVMSSVGGIIKASAARPHSYKVHSQK